MPDGFVEKEDSGNGMGIVFPLILIGGLIAAVAGIIVRRRFATRGPLVN